MSALDFTQMKERALKAQRTRVKLDPTNNATEFTSNSLIQFRIPANVQNTYMDWSNDWSLQFKLEINDIVNGANDVETKSSLRLDKAGASSLIKKLTFRQAGQVLSEVNDYGVLACLMKDLQMSAVYSGNTGRLLEGTTNGAYGEELETIQTDQNITTKASALFSIPLSFNCFANSNKMIPLFGLAPIEIDIELYPANEVGGWNAKSGATFVAKSIGDDAFNVKEVQLTGYYVELSPNAQALISQSVNNQYQICSNNYRVSNINIQDGASAVNEVIPINVSSLERIFIIHRKSAKAITTTADANDTPFTLGNRYYPLLEEYQTFINSQPFPERPVKMEGRLAEAMTEVLMCEHTFGDKNYSSNSILADDTTSDQVKIDESNYNLTYTNANGYHSGGIGSFVVASNFSTLNHGISDKVYGGVSSVGSIVSWRGKYGAGGIGASSILTAISEYEVVLNLNMNTIGTFVLTQ